MTLAAEDSITETDGKSFLTKSLQFSNNITIAAADSIKETDGKVLRKRTKSL